MWAAATSSTASVMFCLGTPTPSLSDLGQAPAAGSTTPSSSCPGSLILSLSCFVSALSSCSILTSLFFVRTLAVGLFFFILVSYCKTFTTLLSCFVLGQAPTNLTSSAFKTFKQVLSDESLRHHSTNSIELFCLYSTLGPLRKKSKCKWLYDTVFINSGLLTGNHTAKEVDLSFREYGWPPSIKLNRPWRLELPDRKPVCIIEVISLVAALFWDPLFAPCMRHTIKSVSKLGLRMPSIANEVIKERIELI